MARTLQESLSEPWQMTRKFFVEKSTAWPIVLIVLGGLFFALSAMRRHVRPWVEKEPGFAPAFRVLDSPMATSLVLTFLLIPWLIGAAPRSVMVILGALVLLPVVHVLHRVVELPLLPALYALLGFYFLDRISLLKCSLSDHRVRRELHQRLDVLIAQLDDAGTNQVSESIHFAHLGRSTCAGCETRFFPLPGIRAR